MYSTDSVEDPLQDPQPDGAGPSAPPFVVPDVVKRALTRLFIEQTPELDENMFTIREYRGLPKHPTEDCYRPVVWVPPEGSIFIGIASVFELMKGIILPTDASLLKNCSLGLAYMCSTRTAEVLVVIINSLCILRAFSYVL